MIKNYLRTALRTLKRNASISGLNIIGLSAGMTAAVLIFLWVDNETSFDSYHPNVDRIYRITAHKKAAGWIWANSPHPLPAVIHGTLPEVETTTSIVPGFNTVFRIRGEYLAEKKSAYVDSSWFRMFHYDFVEGNAADFIHNTYSLILTESAAKKYFGTTHVTGKTIFKDSLDYHIAGVIRDNPANSSFQLDVFIPMQVLEQNPERRAMFQGWGGFNTMNFVKLRPNTDITRTEADISAILYRYKPEDGKKDYFTLTPLRAMHLESNVTHPLLTHGNHSAVYIFSILGIFLLLIACINYVNLTTARAGMRAKEVGIRKIVGAGKQSLFLQFFIESLIVSGISLVLTLAFIQLTLPFFRTLTATNFQSPLTRPGTWKIIGFTLLAATLLNGVYPALLLSSFRPLNTLKGNIILKFKDVYLRKGLVVLQFTFSIILIACTIIIQRQLAYIQHTNPGYDRSQVFYFGLPFTVWRSTSEAAQATLSGSIKAQLLAESSITGVTAASEPIVQVGNASSGGFDWEGHDTAFSPVIYRISADEDYKKVLQLQLLQGRWFDPQLRSDRKNFVFNETAINELGIHQPVVGQWFVFQGDTGKIIGVVKDFHFASLHEKINPLVFHNNENTQTAWFIKTQPGQSTAALEAARKIWQQYVHDKPFSYSFLDDDFDALYKSDAKVSTLILTFSGIAILISCLGLLGLAAFTAQQRIREIGIRKVLGATVTSIITLLSKDFARLVLLSMVLATPVAWIAMHKWLNNFAYHIPLSAWTFAGAGLLAIAIAVLTVCTQSIRAATSNPVKNLRAE